LELSGSAVKLLPAVKKYQGKEWIPSLGFYPKDFNYTSGIICSGSSYRTKYGKFEAKN